MTSRLGRHARIASQRTTVLVAGSRPKVLTSVAKAAAVAGLDICGEATDRRTALWLASQRQPDLCVLDRQLAGNVASTIAKIRARCPKSRVVVLAPTLDEDTIADAIRAGGGVLPDQTPSSSSASGSSAGDASQSVASF